MPAPPQRTFVSRPIPVNLITGFLGVGKTTAIRHLLRLRPRTERWAVLVNEFGEVGVDESLLQGEADAVAVRQVPGGCLCCVSSQAFSVGLNRLVREQRPDRILIEPTGLGHPDQVIATLTGDRYRGVFDLRATITLVDARHLSSPRHREHATWQDQVRVADVLVASKADLYTEDDRQAWARFTARQQPAPHQIPMVVNGALDPEWLNLPRRPGEAEGSAPGAVFGVPPERGDDTPPAPDAPVAAGDWQRVEGRSDGFHSCSWRFGPGVCFDRKRLARWIAAANYDRVKGVLRTDDGWMQLNRVGADGDLEPRATGASEGRLEVVHREPLDGQALDYRLRSAARELPEGA
ncbi:cobalamin synthesis protein P47K [Thioalkalivibrio nitratireducens DSM 14787]|uniref:Cobalamin synthesis protein P47K n=1 Tax=Thioalkalivibrio nitratireducens (strain DSM 14787 / UNIQEM 213 / ALEN2) TaxID=1255043 RepID=L0DWR2_THIND|nr:CobW family GTP-binding protein [Thioalkalivibrio nitratireducens]AGA33442.1 cobalamin synthesis protein P47K [Thioalkalivibrio nitratireducens DSM 14787]